MQLPNDLQRKQFLTVANHWLDTLTPAKRNALTLQVDNVLALAKTTVMQDGLYVDESTGGRRTLSLAFARPQDALELAVNLYQRRFAPFDALLDQSGIGVIFAIVGVSYANRLSLNSLAVISEFLATLLIWEARRLTRSAEKHDRSTRHLPQARKIAAEKKHARKLLLNNRAWEMAVDYKRAHLAAGTNSIIGYLRTFEDFSSWHADSTFANAIKGVHKFVLSGLDTKLPE